MSRLRPGDQARIALLSQDPALQDELAALRLLPGEAIEVVQVTPLGGPILVRAGGLYALGRPIADGIWVDR